MEINLSKFLFCFKCLPFQNNNLDSSYLVLIGPEGAHSQFHLMPLFALGASYVPHRNAQRPTIHPHKRSQSPGAVAIPAIQEVAELDTVCVVLTERLQQQLCSLACSMLRGVHHHVGACRNRRTTQNSEKQLL